MKNRFATDSIFISAWYQSQWGVDHQLYLSIFNEVSHIGTPLTDTQGGFGFDSIII